MRRIVIALVAATLLAGCGDNGTGEKNGVITKFATEGFFCPTVEVEMQRGGLVNGTGVMGQPFDFTIEDPVLAKRLEKAFKEQKEVQIHYRSEAFTFCRAEHANNFLVSFEVIEPGKASGPAASAPTPSAPAGGEARTAGTQAAGTSLTPAQVDELLAQNRRMLDIIEADRKADGAR